MNLIFGAEHEELRATVRRFFEHRSPESEVRRLMKTTAGYDPAVWAQMADQLGLQGLIVPGRFGGAGYGYLELVIVVEEMGRALLCAPYFSTVVMAASLLMASGDEAARKDYLPGIADGSLIATVALAEADGRWDEAGVTLEATDSGDRWTLTGEKLFVFDGVIADLVLVAGRTRGGVSVLAVGKGAAGLQAIPMSTMDQTRKQARLTFDATPARLVGGDGEGWPAISAMLDLAVVALAAEQAGGAQKVLEMAVEYAKVRVQFGRPIGSFQAIKHKCASMLLDVESAKSAAYYAGQAAAAGDAELPVLASLAKSCCSEAYSHAAAENIQIHGGIGFTWEHPAHLYFRRAKSSELLFGDPAYHREMLAQRIGLLFRQPALHCPSLPGGDPAGQARSGRGVQSRHRRELLPGRIGALPVQPGQEVLPGQLRRRDPGEQLPGPEAAIPLPDRPDRRIQRPDHAQRSHSSLTTAMPAFGVSDRSGAGPGSGPATRGGTAGKGPHGPGRRTGHHGMNPHPPPQALPASPGHESQRCRAVPWSRRR